MNLSIGDGGREVILMIDERSPAPGELAEQFRSLADRLMDTTDVPEALVRLVLLATSIIPGCDWAGITQVRSRERFETLAASDPIVRTVDELQYMLHEGPCLDAAVSTKGVVVAGDLAVDTTWPEFSVRAAAVTPVRSVLSLTISPTAPWAALNLYGRQPGSFTVDSVDHATVFAAHAQVLLMYARSVGAIANLNRALTTSRLIGAAVGILMYAHRISADQAYERLKDASQRLNRKLFDVAGEVNQTGTLPTVPWH